MKRILFYIVTALILFSCNKEEKKLELFNAESFAFSLDNGWEVNSSVRVKNFEQQKKDSKFMLNLKYEVQLTTPSGEVITNADHGKLNHSANEELIDYGIDSQIELDSNFVAGNYKITFIVNDLYTSQADTIFTPLELSE